MIMKSSSRLDELLTPSPSRARAWALPKKSSLEPTKKPEPRAEPEPSLGSDPSLIYKHIFNFYSSQFHEKNLFLKYQSLSREIEMLECDINCIHFP